MIGRLRRYLRAHGLKATSAEVGRRLLRVFVREDLITVIVKDLSEISEPRKAGDVVLEDLDADRLQALSQLNRRRGRRGVDRRFRRDLERGMHGFLGCRDGEAIACYWWIEAERADLHPDLDRLGDAIRMEPGDVYGSDFYVLPDQRAGGTANELLFRIESAFRERGYKRIWGYVDSGNREARWIYSSRGYVPIGGLTSRRVLWIRKTAPVAE